MSPNNPTKIDSPDIGNLIVDPPDSIKSPALDAKPWLTRRAQRIDFAERDARNRRLGALAEEWVFELERFRLKQAGRDDLAHKVVWASRDIGDGLGLDILSYDEAEESERILEVKATGMGKYFPFYVTANELRCSQEIPDQFHLFRVLDFAKLLKLYILNGSLSQHCQLNPVLYPATI